MVQEFLTPNVIAPEAIILLQSNLVTANLFWRDYEVQFSGSEKVGDTISIRSRGKGVVREYGGTSITIDDLDEHPISLTLEKHFDLSIKVTSRDLKLDLQNFSEQIMAPNLLEMAEHIDSYAATKLKDLPNMAGPSETAPAGLPNSIQAMALVEKTANDLRWPARPRHQIASTEYKATLLGVDSFVEVDKSGDNDALRQAMINNLMGFDTFMSQNVDTATHTTGTMSSMLAAGPALKGATSIGFDTGNDAVGTILEGDVVVIAGYGNVVCAADVTAVANAGTLTTKEPIDAEIPGGSAMTVYDGGGNPRQNHGAIFHPRAIALAVVPLAAPMSGVNSSLIEDRGFAIRLVLDWDRDLKSDVLSMDVLVGAKVVHGRLGAQIIKNI